MLVFLVLFVCAVGVVFLLYIVYVLYVVEGAAGRLRGCGRVFGTCWVRGCAADFGRGRGFILVVDSFFYAREFCG